MVACLASSFSPEFPVPSALILTGGLAPDATIYSLLAQAPFPIFAAPDDTYMTAKRVSEVRSEIWSGHRRKVASALGLWARRVDEAELLERLHLPRLERMTPLRFLHDLIERARAAAPPHRAAGGQRTSASCAPRRSCTAATSAT